jgi:hypothetical protein
MMADLKLLKEVKFLPKLSLATSPKEYYNWEDYMEDFFWGSWTQIGSTDVFCRRDIC